MIRYDAGTTNPTLLNRLGDWRDHGAWIDFVLRYDPLIRSTCRRYRLDAETAEELCQRVWIEVARRMRSFRYDPGRTFRGWLSRLCRSRAIDLLRQKKTEHVQPLEGPEAESLWHDTPPDLDADEADGSDRALLLRLAEEVQRCVRRRVDERTWTVFWTVDVDGRSVREASEAAGMTYYAAFAARKRVGRMLREEGQRLLLGERRVHEPEVGGPPTD
jgi:RNA polymerase sigma factor (sigma-70 family)